MLKLLIMDKRYISIAICGISIFLCALLPYSSGSPGGKTGSTADGTLCTQCHGGSSIIVNNWISTNIPDSGYIAGETYSITATGTHTGVVKFGFELTAEDNSGSKKGSFVNTNATQTKFTNNNSAVTHKSSGNTPSNNTKSWNFEWIAPVAGTGDITFYAAFNAANGNGSTSGDVIYKTSLNISENTSSGILTDKDNSKQILIFQTTDLNYLTIKNISTDIPETNIRLFDINGKLLKLKSIRNNNMDITLNINDLKTNIYIIQIETKEELISRKVYIQK